MDSTGNKKMMPKGGRKGGTTFPRLNLTEAVKYSAKLVTKTHTAAQPKDVISKGVFNASGSNANERFSALKQYGLSATTDGLYQATPLAKSIEAAATDPERTELLRGACLRPALFKTLFDTFHSDVVTKAKVKQKALTEQVHPESANECVECFVSSLEACQLATVNDDKITIAGWNPENQGSNPTSLMSEEIGNDEKPNDDEEQKEDGAAQEPPPGLTRHRPVVTVNLSIDSSFDTEKLEKQLKLLRKYGAL